MAAIRTRKKYEITTIRVPVFLRNRITRLAAKHGYKIEKMNSLVVETGLKNFVPPVIIPLETPQQN